jgi:hypothetical protein
MKRVVLIFGLLAGAVLSVMMVVQIGFIDQIGFDRGEIIGYTTMVIAFLMVFFGIDPTATTSTAARSASGRRSPLAWASRSSRAPAT